MKLSDEKVAKALGWKRRRMKYQECGLGHSTYRETVYATGNPKEPYWPAGSLPAFTTSLDAIVAEIEARGVLEWHVIKQTGDFYEAVVGWGPGYGASGKMPTAPLALCAALLAYLKENPNGR